MFVQCSFTADTPRYSHTDSRRTELYKNQGCGLSPKYPAQKVEIGNLAIDFPSNISLQKIYLEDQRKDTLLACESIEVNIAMLQLISSKVAISSININGLAANIYRLSPDTSFNFDYIINAFVPIDTLTVAQTEPSSWKISFGNISLNSIRIKYADDVLGYNASLGLSHLNTVVKTFDPVIGKYDIPNFQIDGVQSNIKQYAPKLFSARCRLQILQLRRRSSFLKQSRFPEY